MYTRPLNPITIKQGPPGWVLVELPYSAERLQKIKTIAGRQWREKDHCWAIPQTGRTVERLKALFSGDQIVLAPPKIVKKRKPAGWQPAIRVAPGPAQEIHNTFIQVLQQKAYSPHTIKIYAFHTRRFLKGLKKSPTDLQPEDFKRYLHLLKNQDEATETYTNQAIRSLKALCRLTLHKSPDFLKQAFPPRRKTTL